MMLSSRFLVTLLFLFAVGYSFQVSDYLFENESMNDVSFINFTKDDLNYSIVYLNDDPILLLEENIPISNESKIVEIARNYYYSAYFPDQEALDELKSLITQFNDTRNDGYGSTFKNKEEYFCRENSLFSDGRIKDKGVPQYCNSDEGCLKVSRVVFAVYSEPLRWSDFDYIHNQIKQFSLSSYEVDWILNNYTEKLDTITPETAVEVLTYIRDNADDIKTKVNNMETSVFRFPKLSDPDDVDLCSAQGCYGLCPVIDIEEDIVDSIKNKAQDLLDSLGPLTNIDPFVDSLVQNARNRITFREETLLAAEYMKEYNKISPEAESVLSLAETATTKVDDGLLKRKYDELRLLHASIPNDVSARVFDSVPSDLDKYGALVSEVRSLSKDAMSYYNAAKQKKNKATILLEMVKTSIKTPVSKKLLVDLETRLDQLNSDFKDGLTKDEWQSLENRYSELIVELNQLLDKQSSNPSQSVFLLLKSAANEINQQTSRFDLTQNTPEILSVIFVLGSLGLLTLVFLHIVSFLKLSVPKYLFVFGTWFVSMAIAILLFYGVLYIFMTGENSQSISDYAKLIERNKELALIVDLDSAPSLSDKEVLKSCAEEVFSNAKEKKYVAKVAEIEGSQCILLTPDGASTVSADQCTSLDTATVFELEYSQEAEFIPVNIKRAIIKGDLDYYESCPVTYFVG